MEIGIITGDLKKQRTGIGTYTYHLINELKSRYSITLIRQEQGMDIPGCNSIIIHNPIIQKYNSLLWSQSLKWHGRELKSLDLIHNPGQFLVPPIKKIPTVVTIHDITPVLYPQFHFPFRSWSHRIFLPSVIQNSDKIIAVSECTKNDVCNYMKITPGKVTVIPEAADSSYRPISPHTVSEWKRDYSLNFRYILFVGTIEPRKNIETLLRAFDLIAHEFPQLHLLIAGGIGWNSQYIFREMNGMNSAERIHILNYVSQGELPFLYAGAEVFVFPSWYEGFGIPPLEAMQCGTPVISSNHSSLPEVIGDAGVLLDPGNPSGIAMAITRLLTDEGHRSDLIGKGMRRAASFSWKRTADMTADVYEELMRRI